MSNSPGWIRGNVTRDPEISQVGKNNSDLLKFGIASDKSWRDNDGDWQSETSFYEVIAWRKTAEMAGSLLQKGDAVLVTGNWEQQRWENENGENRSRVVFNANGVFFDVIGLTGVDRRERGNGSKPSSAKRGGSDSYDYDEEPF